MNAGTGDLAPRRLVGLAHAGAFMPQAAVRFMVRYDEYLANCHALGVSEEDARAEVAKVAVMAREVPQSVDVLAEAWDRIVTRHMGIQE